MGAILAGSVQYGAQSCSDAYWNSRYADRTKYGGYLKMQDREVALCRAGQRTRRIHNVSRYRILAASAMSVTDTIFFPAR